MTQSLACPVCLEIPVHLLLLLILHFSLQYTPQILLSTYEMGEIGFRLRSVLSELPSDYQSWIHRWFQGFTMNCAKRHSYGICRLGVQHRNCARWCAECHLRSPLISIRLGLERCSNIDIFSKSPIATRDTKLDQKIASKDESASLLHQNLMRKKCESRLLRWCSLTSSRIITLILSLGYHFACYYLVCKVHSGAWTSAFPLGSVECEAVSVHDVLQWPGVPLKVFTCLLPSVPRVGAGFAANLIGMEQLLKMNESTEASYFIYHTG